MINRPFVLLGHYIATFALPVQVLPVKVSAAYLVPGGFADWSWDEPSLSIHPRHLPTKVRWGLGR